MKTEQTAIKPADLRVGNIANRKYFNPEPNKENWALEPVVVCAININGFNVKLKNGGNSVVDYLEGIPLTGEWLKKFGLNYLQNACWELGSMRIYNLSDDENSRFRITLAGNELVIINYVHQIQNLFHSLTQKELCLNDSI